MATVIDTTAKVSEQAEVILNHRYYLKNSKNEVVEDATAMFQRVAKAIADIEGSYYTLSVEKDLVAIDFYTIMKNLEFVPNSPTLMNAGTKQGTLSACFVLPLEDSMQEIMKASTDSAMVQKFGGGTGFALSKLRPRGDDIKSTHGIACGPIEVLKTLSRVSSMITQGGKRDGANMAVMSVYHPDILDFISCKSTEGDIHNFNISVGVDSNFMEAALKGLPYKLINPKDNTVAGQLNAQEVLDRIIMGAWTNGEPGMVFLDTINKDNHVIEKYGNMIATNPCGEQPLLPNESCNLGSINLAQFFIPYDGEFKDVTNRWHAQIKWDRLKEVVRISTRFLDNVIDANKYATSEIEEMTKATRKIGLGIMGFADLLIQLRIPYNSELARQVAEQVIQEIRSEADKESIELAKIRGVFPAFNDSTYDKENERFRNHCRLTVAPTGTISMIADTSSGIEPTFALAWKKQNILEGKTLNYVNKYFESDAKEYDFYSDELMSYLAEGGSLQDAKFKMPDWVKEVYITSPDISARDHVLMQSVFQEYIDSGVSKTINMPNSASMEEVKDAYILAYHTGCKGITVYRAGSRDKEVLVKGSQEVVFKPCCESPIIIEEAGCQTCKSCGWSACLVA